MRELHPRLAAKLLFGPPGHRQRVGTARFEPWRPAGNSAFILEVRLDRKIVWFRSCEASAIVLQPNEIVRAKNVGQDDVFI